MNRQRIILDEVLRDYGEAIEDLPSPRREQGLINILLGLLDRERDKSETLTMLLKRVENRLEEARHG